MWRSAKLSTACGPVVSKFRISENFKFCFSHTTGCHNTVYLQTTQHQKAIFTTQKKTTKKVSTNVQERKRRLIVAIKGWLSSMSSCLLVVRSRTSSQNLCFFIICLSKVTATISWTVAVEGIKFHKSSYMMRNTKSKKSDTESCKRFLNSNMAPKPNVKKNKKKTSKQQRQKKGVSRTYNPWWVLITNTRSFQQASSCAFSKLGTKEGVPFHKRSNWSAFGARRWTNALKSSWTVSVESVSRFHCPAKAPKSFPCTGKWIVKKQNQQIKTTDPLLRNNEKVTTPSDLLPS